MSSRIKQDRIKNRNVSEKVGARLMWFGFVWSRLVEALIRSVDRGGIVQTLKVERNKEKQ